MSLISRIHESNAGRRRAIRVLGLSAAALSLAPGEASAFLGLFDRREPGYDGFLDDYRRYLQRLRLRRVDVDMVIESHLKVRGGVRNTPPPRSMWKRIKPVLKVADRIADELDRPLDEVVSAYRSPAYNARCPGARSRSMHLQNMALDLKYAARPSEVAKVAVELRRRGKFKGGIGRYWSFTHIDTRGRNVDW